MGPRGRASTPGTRAAPAPSPPARAAQPLLAVGGELHGAVREEAQAGHRVPLPQGPGPLGPPQSKPRGPRPPAAAPHPADLGQHGDELQRRGETQAEHPRQPRAQQSLAAGQPAIPPPRRHRVPRTEPRPRTPRGSGLGLQAEEAGQVRPEPGGRAAKSGSRSRPGRLRVGRVWWGGGGRLSPKPGGFNFCSAAGKFLFCT